MRFESWPDRSVWLLNITVAVLAFIVTAQLAFKISLTGTDMPVLWLPAGVSLAAVLIFGTGIWPAFAIASFLTTFFFLYPSHSLGAALIATAFTAAASTLSPLLGAALIRGAIGSQVPIEDIADIILPLAWGGAVSQALYAVIGLAGACLAGMAAWTNFISLWLNWWVANYAAVLVITPFILSWSSARRQIKLRHFVPVSVLIYSLVLLSSVLAFFPSLWLSIPTYFKYLNIPVILYATYRLGQRGATLSILIVSLVAVWGTLQNFGPFAVDTPENSLILMDIYLATIALTAFFVESVLVQRRQAEVALRDSEQRLRTILDSVNDAIFVYDPASGSIRDANPRAEELFGYTRAEILREGIEAFSSSEPPYTYQAARPAIIKAAAGAPQLVEWQVRTKTGRLFWVEANIRRTSIRGRERLVMAMRDISERKKVEGALQESQRAMTTLLSNLQGMAYRCQNDPSWTMNFVSQGCQELTGYAPQDLIGNSRISYNEIIFPDDRQKVWDAVQSALSEQKPFHLTYRVTTASGIQKWVMEQGRGIFTEAGEIVGIEGYISDISELKQAEGALAQEQYLVNALLDSTPDAIYFKDLENRFIRVSKSHVEKFGLANAEEAIGKTDFDFFDAEQARLFYAGEQEIIRTGRPMIAVEEEEIWPDRPSNWVSTTKLPLQDREGRIIGTFGLSRDITERKVVEEALRSSEQKYRTIIEQFAEGFSLIDREGRIIEWNQAMETISGVRREEALGTFFWELQFSFVLPERQTPEIKERIKSRWVRHLQDEQSAVGQLRESIIQSRDGTRKYLQELFFPIKTEKGILIGHITQDITRRKQRELEFESISAVSAALRRAANRLEMLPVILDQLTDLLKADGAAIGMKDPASDDIVFEMTRGVFERSQGIHLRPGEGEIGRVIGTGQPYLENNLKGSPGLAQTGWLRLVKAMAVVPLAAQGSIIGVLVIGRDRDISEDDVRVLAAVADISASAIQRTSLHEQTERRLMHLSALRRIDVAINNSLDLKITLEILLEQALAQLHVDAVDVLMLNPHLHSLEYAAGLGFRSTAIERAQLQFGEGHAGRAAAERVTVSVPNLPDLGSAFVRAGPLAGEGFITYHAVPLVAKGHVHGVLEVFHRTNFGADPEWLAFLETLAGQAAIAIDNATLFKELEKSNIELTQAFDSTLASLAKALALRDQETEEHSHRSTDLTLRLARSMGIEDEELVNIRRGAWLHDFGKIGVSDTILNKAGPLTPEEWVVMRRHPAYANEMLSLIPFLRPALDIPFCHHEKWDGSGYPRGLKDEEIPLAARIFAVVDVWDALLSRRTYRDAWPRERALAYIQEQSGKHFDPHVVEMFLKILENEGLNQAPNQ
jgi:PAS domain S-box-containing protein